MSFRYKRLLGDLSETHRRAERRAPGRKCNQIENIVSQIKTVGIIGAGLSGLAAGVALARRGIRVELFEAKEKLGGCCATTQQQGYTFNDGALYVAVPELLDHAFDTLGIDRSTAVPLRRITSAVETTLPDDTVVAMGIGSEVKVHGRDGEARSARAASEVESLLNRWRPVLRLFADDLLTQPPSTARLLLKAWRHLPKFRGTVAAELERAFSDPAVRAAMSGVLLYTGLPPQQMPVFQLIGLVALLDSGFYLPEGGMGAIPQALSTTLLQHGGKIHTGAKVKKIRVTRNRVFGLEVHGHGTVAVDAAISTVSGMLTFGSLLDAENVPESLRRKARNAPLSQKALSIQLGLSNRLEARSHSVSRLPFMEEQQQALLPGSEAANWTSYSVPTVTMPQLAPPGGSIVEMFPPIDQTWAIDRWTQQTTQAAAESAIATLSRLHNLDIATSRVRSPKDYRDTMHLFGGAVYGLSPAAGPTAQFPHRTPIRGLLQAGQTTYPGYGTSTAIWSGIFAAQALL